MIEYITWPALLTWFYKRQIRWVWYAKKMYPTPIIVCNTTGAPIEGGRLTVVGTNVNTGEKVTLVDRIVDVPETPTFATMPDGTVTGGFKIFVPITIPAKGMWHLDPDINGLSSLNDGIIISVK